MKLTISLIALVAAIPAFAEETRHLDAHEHGVATLNIAMDGATVHMEFQAPGADIVGFEYAASSEADLAKIEVALDQLRSPLELFDLPEAAGCRVAKADAVLVSDDHAEEGHEEHDDHAHEEHDDHAHEEHDDHAHEEHDDHDHEEHDDHGHEEHDDVSGHTEFEAHFALTCESPDAFTEMSFPYFELFPNAKEVEVQFISASGAKAFDVERAAPTLDLER
ncbi:DUF2796 domain-containing protein [uncultured Pelagimonas sp.]|uniref:zinc uptake protein ZrgA n=1 Tax=uncultured Pelagimonas sp. TaxID=1618102 RepID=UPI0026039781|nr:DUF2796 domain-containing protein [uncultured Pelagimonas sp.]